MIKIRILNVGCGDDTYGTHFVDKYPKRKEVIKCDLDWEKLPFKSNYFDEVVCKNVLEHLTNPGFALKEMYRVLKKGGKLLLITDNANYWRWAIGKTHLGGYERHSKHKGDRHYSLFTDWHLINHAKKVGFKKIKVEYVMSKIKSFNLKELLLVIDLLLSLTPFKRMGYGIIKLYAKK